MMTIANNVYSGLKRYGLHHLFLINVRQSDFDFDDLDDIGPVDPDCFLIEFEE